MLGISAVIAAVSTILTLQLGLRTSFAELLPSDDPAVVTLRRTQARMGEIAILLVAVKSPDREANIRYAERLTKGIEGLGPSIVSEAAFEVRDLLAFIKEHRWLYAEEADLEEIRDRLKKEILRRKNPLFAPLDDEEGGEDGIAALETRLKSRQRSRTGAFQDGVFASPDGQTVWVAAVPASGLFGEHPGEALYAGVRKLIAADPPDRHHPQMQAVPAGPIVTTVRNQQAVQRDVMKVAALCMTAIALSLWFFFRRVRAVLLIAAPAVLATLAAHAVARLVFGYLTSVTAFLVAFIMGNGTNYAIVLLARYEEERVGSVTAREAVDRAVQGVRRSTLVAALASALGYASLLTTSFRGFSQFGVIGGVGCMLAWAATLTVLPALLVLVDYRPRPVRADRGPTPLDRLGGVLRRRPWPFLVASATLSLVAAVATTRFLDDPFEYDFRKLSARSSTGDQDLKEVSREADKLFGRLPEPMIVLADRTEDVEPVRDAIFRQDRAASGHPVVGKVYTVNDLLPGPPDVQARKRTLLAQIRKLLADPGIETLSQQDRDRLAALDVPADPPLLKPTDLPRLARLPFTERDGTVGRVVLVYPLETGFSMWSGKDLIRLSSAIQNIRLPDGRVVESSGSAVVFGAMIRSILRDGPVAVSAALLAVVLLVLARVRPFRAGVAVIVTLLLGVLWMVGAAGALQIRVNFLNFIALPFIIGIGAEYAINIISRVRETGRMEDAVSSTGGAVALCSWSAIVGYGSLLVSQNRALQGFGAVATIGELACLLAALFTLPVALVLWDRRTRRARAAAAAPPS